jgi:hypothetical protein
MVTLLEILAVLAGLFGLISLSQATLGVGVIGFGCLLAILARLAQAEAHHKATNRSDSSPQARSIQMAE